MVSQPPVPRQHLRVRRAVRPPCGATLPVGAIAVVAGPPGTKATSVATDRQETAPNNPRRNERRTDMSASPNLSTAQGSGAASGGFHDSDRTCSRAIRKGAYGGVVRGPGTGDSSSGSTSSATCSSVLARSSPSRRSVSSCAHTFRVHGVTWEWRDESGRTGHQSWPHVDPAQLPDPTPDAGAAHETSAGPVVPTAHDQELSIPYLLDGLVYQAFVLGRRRDDFDDDDLALAGHLQGLLRGLFLHLQPGARVHSRAGHLVRVCGAHRAHGDRALRARPARGRPHDVRHRASAGDGASDGEQAPRAHLSQARRHPSHGCRERRPRSRPRRSPPTCQSPDLVTGARAPSSTDGLGSN